MASAKQPQPAATKIRSNIFTYSRALRPSDGADRREGDGDGQRQGEMDREQQADLGRHVATPGEIGTRYLSDFPNRPLDRASAARTLLRHYSYSRLQSRS